MLTKKMVLVCALFSIFFVPHVSFALQKNPTSKPETKEGHKLDLTVTTQIRSPRVVIRPDKLHIETNIKGVSKVFYDNDIEPSADTTKKIPGFWIRQGPEWIKVMKDDLAPELQDITSQKLIRLLEQGSLVRITLQKPLKGVPKEDSKFFIELVSKTPSPKSKAIKHQEK